MEENNNNLNETPVSGTSNTDTTGNPPVSDTSNTDTINNSLVSDPSNTDTTNNSLTSAPSNTDTTNKAPASAFDIPTTNAEPIAPASTVRSTDTNPAATTTTSAPSYYTSPGSNSTTSNTYVYNDTIISSSDETATGFGIASLVMGIISIFTSCCCGLGILFSILGIIFGCIQPQNTYGKKPGVAIAGIILSSVAILFSIFAIIYFMAIGTFSNTI